MERGGEDAHLDTGAPNSTLLEVRQAEGGSEEAEDDDTAAAAAARSLAAPLRVRVMEWGGDDAHLAALNSALLVGQRASELNNYTLLEEGEGGEAADADAAAAAAAAAAPLLAATPADMDVARRVAARRRACVAARNARSACPLLDLLETVPDLVHVVLRRGSHQGRTLVNFSAQFERFVWDRGCA
jgi:hypothetical protein